MATPTTHYNLLKPQTGETYNVQTLDDNYDKIDTAIYNSVANVVANTSVVTGSAGGLGAGLANHSIMPVIQAGSIVLTPAAGGFSNFAWPTPFLNGIISVVLTNGDDGASGTNVHLTLGNASQSLTTCYFNATVTNTGAGYTNPVRVNYIAIGW